MNLATRVFSIKVNGEVRYIAVEMDARNQSVCVGSVLNALITDYGSKNVSYIPTPDIDMTYSFREVMDEKYLLGRPLLCQGAVR